VQPVVGARSVTSAAMDRGLLRLSNGFGATCEYELTGDASGRMKLPSALYLPMRETDAGTLKLFDGEERKVQVTFGPVVGEASFLFVE
jgi:hypothetical protein